MSLVLVKKLRDSLVFSLWEGAASAYEEGSKRWLPEERARWESLRCAATQGRLAEFLRARAARERALEALGLYLEDASFSLAHTGKSAVAAVMPRDMGRVGVDVERSDRQVSDGVWNRLVPTAEEREKIAEIGFSRIQVWCLKEAAWKASPRQEGTQISQVVVRSREEAEVPGGLRVRLHHEELGALTVFFAVSPLDFGKPSR